MKIVDALDKFADGTILYIVKEIDIRWDTMRILNTTIVPAKYVVDSEETSLWAPVKHLKRLELPKGTGHYIDKIYSSNKEYRCFQTETEAEVWKVIELQGLDNKVDDYIETMKHKVKKKIKSIKQHEQFDNYLTKYPEQFLKVIE